MSEYIEREAALESVRDKVLICESLPDTIAKDASLFTLASMNDSLKNIPAADVRPVPDGGIGEMSDGYHTFNGLYYQRMVLFAALVKAHKDKAWKSWRHEDGELCFGGGWFIVGIDTPQGSYTYHYEAKDFDLFDCEELPVAKHWDGHTEKDVTRLLSLDMPRWIPVTERLPGYGTTVLVYGSQGGIYTARYERARAEWGRDSWWKLNSKSHICNPTHWMPLPQPPKEE